MFLVAFNIILAMYIHIEVCAVFIINNKIVIVVVVVLYSYLNTHLKKQKQDYGEISPYSTSFCPDTMEEVMDIGAVSFYYYSTSMHWM